MATREMYRERIIEALDGLQSELYNLHDELRDVEYIALKPPQDASGDELLLLAGTVRDTIKGLSNLIDKLS